VTDERRDDERDDGEDDDAKGLGLTEEFARLESEIEREASRGREEAGDEPVAEDDEETAAPASGDEDDSSEWAPPPIEAEGDAGEPEDEADAEAEDQAEGEGEPEEEPGPDESEADPSEDDSASTPPADSDEGVHDGVPDSPTEVGEVPVDDSATEHTVVRDRERVPIAAAAYREPIDEADLKPKTPALWWRFLTGSVIIVAAIAASVAVSSLLVINSIASDLTPIPHVQNKLKEIPPGDP
jgi:hypothetical protein